MDRTEFGSASFNVRIFLTSVIRHPSSATSPYPCHPCNPWSNSVRPVSQLLTDSSEKIPTNHETDEKHEKR